MSMPGGALPSGFKAENLVGRMLLDVGCAFTDDIHQVTACKVKAIHPGRS